MVSTISFIQANLQHSVAASRILSRTISGNGIDIALIQEPWYREACIRDLNILGYTLYSAGGTGLGHASWWGAWPAGYCPVSPAGTWRPSWLSTYRMVGKGGW
jgi:hypothetical protein